MVKSTLFYGITTGINKGAPLLLMPFLISVLSISEFGIYSLAQTLISLLTPVISLNGGAAILREGLANRNSIKYLLFKFGTITILLTLVLAFILYFLDSSSSQWLFFAIIIGGFEAIGLLVRSSFRALEDHLNYFLLTLFKTIGFLGVIYYVSTNNLGLRDIFYYQFLMVVVLMTCYFIYVSTQLKYLKIITVSATLVYCLPLIPNGISQWILSGSDRFILKFISGEEAVGIYSLGYTVAMVLMLINSGISLALPQGLIKHYDKWKDGVLLLKYFKIYTIISLVLLIFIDLFIWLDEAYFNILKYHTVQMNWLVGIVFAGLYTLGAYYFYSVILFYHKLTKVIATQTMKVAVINILLTIGLVYLMGTIGAAIATLIAYLCYYLMVKKQVEIVEPEMVINSRPILPIILICISFVLGFQFIFNKIIF